MKISDLKKKLEGLPEDMEIYVREDNSSEIDDLENYELIFKR
jgi:hypothetical protein